jgi:hypothetical protein
MSQGTKMPPAWIVIPIFLPVWLPWPSLISVGPHRRPRHCDHRGRPRRLRRGAAVKADCRDHRQSRGGRRLRQDAQTSWTSSRPVERGRRVAARCAHRSRRLHGRAAPAGSGSEIALRRPNFFTRRFREAVDEVIDAFTNGSKQIGDTASNLAASNRNVHEQVEAASRTAKERQRMLAPWRPQRGIS